MTLVKEPNNVQVAVPHSRDHRSSRAALRAVLMQENDDVEVSVLGGSTHRGVQRKSVPRAVACRVSSTASLSFFAAASSAREYASGDHSLASRGPSKHRTISSAYGSSSPAPASKRTMIELRNVFLGEPGVFRCALDGSQSVSDLARAIKTRHTAVPCKWWQLEHYIAVPPEGSVNSVTTNSTNSINSASPSDSDSNNKSSDPQQRLGYIRADDDCLQTLQRTPPCDWRLTRMRSLVHSCASSARSGSTRVSSASPALRVSSLVVMKSRNRKRLKVDSACLEQKDGSACFK